MPVTITKIPPSNPPAAELDNWLTVEAVATALCVHHTTVRRWIKAGKLKAKKVGGTVRIRSCDLNVFINGEDV
ncbi:MAG: helix-turn-helix domain-containing protein [Thalassobaculum sp.]|jgi:excisionase family DNA binding protein